MKSLFETYFDFHYGIGLVIGVVIFCGCMRITGKNKRKQGRKISDKEVFWCLALSIYITCLLGTTLLNRKWSEGVDVRLDLFWSYRLILETSSSWTAKQMVKQIVLNILAFVPWGFLVTKCFGESVGFRKVVGSAFLMSVGIELVQLVGQCGLCELDDVVHNTLGAVVGYGVYDMIYLRGKM